MPEPSVLITGASGLIGKALVKHFTKCGFSVIGVSRSAKSVEKLAQEFPDSKRASFHAVDLTNSRSIARFVRQMEKDRRECNFVINSARSIRNLDPQNHHDKWSQLLEEFTLGVAAAHELVVSIAESNSFDLRAVVNLSSIYSFTTINPRLYRDSNQIPPAAYSVTKAALNGLTRELAVRLGPSIRVNGIALGGVAGRADEGFKTSYETFSGIGRMLTLQDVCGPVKFLLSDEASGMTGHIMVVDAGWTLT